MASGVCAVLITLAVLLVSFSTYMLQFRMGMKKHTGDNFLYRIAGTSPLCGQYPGRVNAATAGLGWIKRQLALH